MAIVPTRGECHAECYICAFSCFAPDDASVCWFFERRRKPIILAEGVNVRIGGVGVGVGERHQYRGHAGLYMSERGTAASLMIGTTTKMK